MDLVGTLILDNETELAIEDDLARLSPARFEHINPYGKCNFAIDESHQRESLRPLRTI